MEEFELNKDSLTKSSIIQMLKTALAMFPPLNFAVDLYSNYQQNVQYNNIVDVLHKHSCQLKKIEDFIDKSYMSSIQYAKDMYVTIQRAKDELNEDKRTIYASYITSCCLSENSNDHNKELYLDYIGRLDFIDIFILRNLSKYYNGKDAVEFCTSNYNIYHENKVSKLDIQIHLEHLSSMGVVERCDREEVDKFNQRVGNVKPRGKIFKKFNYYQRTYLGDGIYTFITKAEYAKQSDTPNQV